MFTSWLPTQHGMRAQLRPDDGALGRSLRILQAISDVNCGERFSTACELCPGDDGARQCRGDCSWDAMRVGPGSSQGDPRCYRTTDDSDADSYDAETQLFISIGLALGMVVLIIVCCVAFHSAEEDNVPAAVGLAGMEAGRPAPQARSLELTAVSLAPNAANVLQGARVPSVDSTPALVPSPGIDAAAQQHRAAPPQQPMYAEWQRMYNVVKSSCMFGDALDFVEANPSTVNNRQGGPSVDSVNGSGWTLLHQAAYWKLTRALVERLAACGADPLIVGRDGCTAVEVSTQTESAESRQAWRTMMCEVFGLPAPAVATAAAEGAEEQEEGEQEAEPAADGGGGGGPAP